MSASVPEPVEGHGDVSVDQVELVEELAGAGLTGTGGTASADAAEYAMRLGDDALVLAQQLGKVPLPGATTEVAGLRLTAEGGKDSRGRVRITSVLIEPVTPPEPDEQRDPDERHEHGAENSRHEESDVRQA